jgi:hypothetical protein
MTLLLISCCVGLVAALWIYVVVSTFNNYDDLEDDIEWRMTLTAWNRENRFRPNSE